MQIYNVYQSGKRLYIDEKEIPDNKIVVNKYDNMQQTLRLISDGTLPPRLYWALRNPKLSNKYFILKLVNNEDLIVGTDIPTIEEFRTYLNENPVELTYKTLSEQAFIPLPDEEQTLLNNLEMYYGVTNIYNEQGCPMWLTYVQSPQICMENVNKKIEEINNALLSLGANV